jgi:hypothetical protein
MEGVIEPSPEGGIPPEKVSAGWRQPGPPAVVAASRPRDQLGAERRLRVGQVAQDVPVGPPDAPGGATERPCGVDGPQELDPAVAEGEPVVGFEPDLIPDGEPM